VRLHRLRITAFQAFAGSEEVDFDALSEAGLFLLHGDTGAGKTTLLDAVCFALYGDLPGARARDARVRSDHADPATRTEVELEVTLRERRLRIVRRPRQERPKLRGEGFTEESHACTVEALEGGAWVVLAARPEEAKAELADLLGMSCEQFCQVVLLPQGEFASFLRADSTERQAVLERLFGTDRFARVEGWLTDRRKTMGGDLRDAMQGVRDVVSRLSEVAGEEAPEAWADEPVGTQEWASRLCVAAEAGAATAGAVRDAAGAARTTADAALTSAVELAERRSRHTAAVEELARWDGKRADRSALEAELSAARRAAPVAALLAAAAARADEARVASDHAALALKPGVSDCHASDPEALRAHAADARGAAGALDALVEVEQRLARGDAELAALATEADTAEQAAARVTQAIEAATDQRASLDASVTAAREATVRAERLTAAARTARARAASAAERDRLATERIDAEDRLRAAIDAEQQAHATWLGLRERRLAGMAAELAAGLEPGEPCAVCGAREHPAPAHGSLFDVPLAEQERTAERQHATAAEARAAAERALATMAAALAAAGAVAGDAAAGALTVEAELLADELQAATAQASVLDGAEQALDKLATATAEHEQSRRAAERRQATARATHAERTALLAADRSRVTVARGEAETVAARAAQLRADADAADAAAAAVEHAARAETARDEAATAAQEAAATAGFEHAAAAQAAVRDDDAQADLDRRRRVYDDGLAQRSALANDPLLLAAAQAEAPDLPTLQAAAQAAREADDDATRRDGLERQRLVATTRLAAELDDALTQLAPLAERERRVRELAYLVDGSSTSNRLRMRLSAYVLAARLEEVAAAATMRLERMSNGRFQLIHTDERARGERRAGLELRVVDGWTSRERAPATLSGGETFLASLALALGLADVVAAEAGGSRLETLFIDEGFGSLDEATLDEVLDVLDTLREGGRAVGIVSHVAELRQRIPARLHVVKSRTGSHVEQRESPVAA
jgi:DNA repair protein SbcC/Rad50